MTIININKNLFDNNMVTFGDFLKPKKRLFHQIYKLIIKNILNQIEFQ